MTKAELQRENDELRRQLAEAENALRAIREGQVDAIVVEGQAGAQVFSLAGAETVYRLAVQTMAEAVINVDPAGTILFSNARFSEFVGLPAEQLIGRQLSEFVALEDRPQSVALLAQCGQQRVRQRIVLCGPNGRPRPVQLTGEALVQAEGRTLCLVAADLSELESSAHQLAELRQSRTAALQSMADALAARQQAERAAAELGASEQRFRALTEKGADVIGLVDSTGRLNYESPNQPRVLRYRAGGLIGRNMFELVHPEDLPSAVALFAQLVAEPGGSRGADLRVRTGEDDWCWLEIVGTNLQADPAVAGIVLNARDITARKRMEQALAHERDLLQTVMNGPRNVHLVYLDRDFNFVRVNEAYAAACGYRPTEMIGKNHFALYTDAENEAIFRRVRDTGEPFEIHDKPFEFPGDHARGVTYWDWSLTPVSNADGRVAGLVLALHETTARKRAELALRESEQRLALAASGAQVGIFTLDSATGEGLATEQALQIIGLRTRAKTTTPAALSQTYSYRQWAERVHPEDLPALEAMVAQAAADGSPIELEYRVIWPDGSVHWLAVRAMYVAEESASRAGAPGVVGDHTLTPVQPARVLGVVIDITARKQAETELQRLNATLEQQVAERTAQLTAVNAELEAFCYSVSHDLRAPLRSMDGFSRILLQTHRDQLDAEAQSHLHRIRSNCQRMGQLIDDLLRLSRLTRAEMRWAPLDLTAMVSSLGEELRQRDPARVVEWRIAAGLRTVADADLLRVAVGNLLENAWKFTGKQARAVIEVGQLSGQSEPVFYVRDNGAGFDMAHADKLFGAFQRLHTLSEFPGNGIGLALVQRVISRHGGRIWAEAAPGQGATFYFTLAAANRAG